MIKKNFFLVSGLFLVYSIIMLAIKIFINESDKLHFYWDTVTWSTYLFSAVYLTVLTVFYIKRLQTRPFSFRKFKDIFEFIIIPVISLILISYTSCAVVNSSITVYNRRDIFIIHVISLALCLTSVILTERISRNRELEIQNILMKREQELYQNQIRESDSYIREISSIRHDMKNKLLCLSEFMNENKIAQAQELCGKMESELSNSSYIFTSGNIYLNAILNVIYRRAKENHADMKTTLKSELNGIDGEDIITIIGNLCDNAIESKAETINISISEKGSYYIITVKNAVQNSVLENNPDLYSTKNDSLYHGHGINSVRAAAKKYDGEVSIFENDGQFIVSVMLKIPSTTETIPTTTNS